MAEARSPPRGQETAPDLSPRLAAIEKQLADLAARPAPASVDPKALDDIAARLARLESALGDEVNFSSVIAQLEADPGVRQAEAASICKLFYGDASSSTTRREALRRIRARHDSLMDYIAKSHAQSGKTAA